MQENVAIVLKILGSSKIQREFSRVSESMNRLRRSVFSLKGAFAGLGIGLLIKSFLDAASTAENYRVRLVTLLGSVEEANRLFKEMSKFASTVTFEYEEIMGAATDLAAVMEGGVEEVKRYMPIIADLAAATGLSIRETTSQIIRMYSAGAAAADLFRERGVLAMLGFQTGVSYSAEATRKRLIQAWEDPLSKFRGASRRLASTWDGLISMLKDYWFMVRNMVMNAAPYEYLKSAVDLLIKYLRDHAQEVEEFSKKVGKKVVETVKKWAIGIAGLMDIVVPLLKTLWGWVKLMWDGFKSLPAWVRDVGIIGAFLGGKKLRLALLGALTLLGAIQRRLEDIKSVSSKVWQSWGAEFPLGAFFDIKKPSNRSKGRGGTKRTQNKNLPDLPDLPNAPEGPQSFEQLVTDTIRRIEENLRNLEKSGTGKGGFKRRRTENIEEEIKLLELKQRITDALHKSELQEIERQKEKRLAELKILHRLYLISDKEYNERKLNIEREALVKKEATLKRIRQQVENYYNKEIGLATKAGKKNEEIEKLRAEKKIALIVQC